MKPTQTEISLAVARGGWVRVDGLDGPYTLYVRYGYKTNAAGGIVDYATNSAGEVVRAAGWRPPRLC